MQVRVLYFGVLKDLLGDAGESLELADGATVGGLVQAYQTRAAAFSWKSAAVAVNGEYASAEVVLHDGDEVALLPPVSGGCCADGMDV